MEKIIPSFKYEPLILSLELETSNEEDKGDIDGVRPLGTKILEELGNLRGGKDNPKREDVKQTLKQV
jgi:hypothetical protein